MIGSVAAATQAGSGTEASGDDSIKASCAPGHTRRQRAVRDTTQNEGLASDDEHPDWYVLDVADVATRLGVSRKSIYRDPRRFGGKRVRSRWRFSATSILRGLR